jgi:hypothetical protein
MRKWPTQAEIDKQLETRRAIDRFLAKFDGGVPRETSSELWAQARAEEVEHRRSLLRVVKGNKP